MPPTSKEEFERLLKIARSGTPVPRDIVAHAKQGRVRMNADMGVAGRQILPPPPGWHERKRRLQEHEAKTTGSNAVDAATRDDDTNAQSANLYERIHDRFAAAGGVDLQLPPREPGREPPRFDFSQTIPKVYDLRRSCIACPAQWEGRVNDHGSIYIRYRWGRLTVRISLTDANAVGVETCFFEDDIGCRTGDRLGGYMETDEMRKSLEGVCHFYGECDEESWQSE
jgi:hypothetical protein